MMRSLLAGAFRTRPQSIVPGARALTLGPCLRAMLVLFFALSVTACEETSRFSFVGPEIFGEPEAGTAIVFDEVVLGRTTAEPRIVRIGNRGQADLIVTDLRLQGEGAEQFRLLGRPSALAPGQFGEIFIEFEPTAPVEHNATLVVRSNDAERGEVSWPLVGPAREPCSISAGPDFQNFQVGEIREVTIQAAASYKCVITGIQTDRNLFEILNEPEAPFEIAAGEQLTLQVQHINASVQPGGTPTREMLIRELEGTEAVVILAGEPPVQGCLSASPSRILFPRVERGATSTQFARVRNTCAEPASLTSLAMSDGFNFYSVDDSAYPLTVQPLQTVDIPVTYTAFSPLGDLGLLTINTNDATSPRFRIELYGEADIPQAQIFPRDIDFGTVVFRNPQGADSRSECSSNAKEVRIYSVGAATLRIASIELDQSSDAFFQVTSVLLDGEPIFDLTRQIAVPPDSVVQISVQFAPTRIDPSVHNASLRVVHDGEEGTSVINLQGGGVPDGEVNDVFEQLEGPTVDILWVIDDSCSMYDEQARLTSNLSQFVGYADSQNADYQMAVTVTDSRSSNAGKFRRCWPHPQILSGDYADPTTRAEAFECTFLVGTGNISFYESGLGGAMRALERATSNTLDPATNVNAGFVRDNAKLAIVTVSDEDDQSAESDRVLEDYFLSIKGFNRPDQVAVHSIAGPVANQCAQGPRFAQPGYRYFRMTQQTGGRFFDICETDWQPLLNGLGLDVFTPLDEWNLTQAADPGTLAVAIDGVTILPDPVNGYTYSLASNSIRFNGTSLPTPGAQITVDYRGLCRP